MPKSHNYQQQQQDEQDNYPYSSGVVGVGEDGGGLVGLHVADKRKMMEEHLAPILREHSRRVSFFDQKKKTMKTTLTKPIMDSPTPTLATLSPSTISSCSTYASSIGGPSSNNSLGGQYGYEDGSPSPYKRRRFQRRNSKTSAMLVSSMAMKLPLFDMDDEEDEDNKDKTTTTTTVTSSNETTEKDIQNQDEDNGDLNVQDDDTSMQETTTKTTTTADVSLPSTSSMMSSSFTPSFNIKSWENDVKKAEELVNLVKQHRRNQLLRLQQQQRELEEQIEQHRRNQQLKNQQQQQQQHHQEHHHHQG